MKKYQVTKTSFLFWYFSDREDIIKIGCRAINNLNDDGEFIITTHDLFDECGYIPNWICEGEFDKECDINTDEVELIN